MTRLFYALEDHFDALADRRQGFFSRRLSRALTRLFGWIGDILQASSDSTKRRS